MSGFFVTFEGGEGAGKSTQLRRLGQRLGESGYDVVETREPGGSEGAEALRHVLLSGAARRFGDPNLETVLFAAARADHVAALIRPALDAGSVVLCDRFLDSTRVYQDAGAGGGELVSLLEKATLGDLLPDLTLVIDLPVDLGLDRAAKRRAADAPDRFEAEDRERHEARRQHFLRIAAAEPQRCAVVDGARPEDEVAREIAFIVEDRLEARRLEGRLGPPKP